MALKVTNLSKRYGDQWVLRDVSFEAQEGEILGIYGLIGAGKSTVVRILAGTEKAGSGVILHNSNDITALPAEQRNFCFPQIADGTFWQRLFQSGKKPPIPEGEKQSRLLAESLERAGSVLLLDDYFCCMDHLRREDSYRQLRAAVREKNLTAIVATGHPDEMMALCDRVIVLHQGEVLQTGRPREIYENPASAMVARISGKNNLIEARRITSNKAEIPEFQTIKGAHRLFTNKIEKLRLGTINQNVLLAIRPEHISISFGASFPEDNLLKATVTAIRFQGATTLIELDSNGLALEAMVLRLVGLNVGDECMVGLPPDRILVLKV